MIYVAYNLIYYKYNNKDLNKKNKEVDKIIKNYFGLQKYILPYSLQTTAELAKKLKCNINELRGEFIPDIKTIVSKCNNLLIFPTENNYIGWGIYLEYMLAKKYNLNIYVYNEKKNLIVKKFKIKSPNIKYETKDGINTIFYKKIIF